MPHNFLEPHTQLVSSKNQRDNNDNPPSQEGESEEKFLWSNHKHQDTQTEQDIPKAWCNECLLFTVEESPQSHIKVLLTLRGNPSSGAKT